MLTFVFLCAIILLKGISPMEKSHFRTKKFAYSHKKGVFIMPRKKPDPTKSALIDMNTMEMLHKKQIPVICRRIKYYRERLGIEQKELGARLNVIGNAVSNWENGRARPDINLLPELCSVLGITLYELFNIEDPLLRHTKREQYLLSSYRNMSEGNKYLVDSLIQSIQHIESLEEYREVKELTLFDKPLAAGIGDPTEFDDTGEPLYLYASSDSEKADCAFNVNGDSMEPTFSDGDVVLVQRYPNCSDLSPGDIGAFIVGNELYIKEYQKDGLYSHNENYDPMHFEDHERVYFIGKVIGAVDDKDFAEQEDINRYLLASEGDI